MDAAGLRRDEKNNELREEKTPHFVESGSKQSTRTTRCLCLRVARRRRPKSESGGGRGAESSPSRRPGSSKGKYRILGCPRGSKALCCSAVLELARRAKAANEAAATASGETPSRRSRRPSVPAVVSRLLQALGHSSEPPPIPEPQIDPNSLLIFVCNLGKFLSSINFARDVPVL